MKIEGCEIFIERLSGNGPLNFVLIHNAGGDHHFFTHQIQTLKHLAPQFEIGKVIGSKCWATLEVPEQVNAMIERFLITHS